MEIPSAFTPTTLSLSASQLRGAVDAWRVGQVLDAEVVEQTAAADTLVLKIGNALVSAQGKLPQLLPQGTLQLQVVALKPQPILQVLPHSSTADSPLSQALRQALPRQAPLPALLANLEQLVTSREQPMSAALPRDIAAALQQLVRTLPTPAQITTPAGLKQAIDNAGAFLESKLQKPATPAERPATLTHDFKAALLRLLAPLKAQVAAASAASAPGAAPRAALAAAATALAAAPPPASAANATESGEAPAAAARPANPTVPVTSPRIANAQVDLTPPPLRQAPLAPQPRAVPTVASTESLDVLLRDLTDQVEGAVARITVAQLSHLPPDSETKGNAWTFELPVRHQSGIDLIQLRIEKDPHADHEKAEASGWNVSLSFAFPETGPFYAQLRVQGKRVHCRFTAEKPETAQRLSQHMARLEKSLLEAGLEVADLRCRQGVMPTGVGRHHTPILDISA
jgi:hypothetical protein